MSNKTRGVSRFSNVRAKGAEIICEACGAVYLARAYESTQGSKCGDCRALLADTEFHDSIDTDDSVTVAIIAEANGCDVPKLLGIARIKWPGLARDDALFKHQIGPLSDAAEAMACEY